MRLPFGFEIKRRTMAPEDNPEMGFSIPTKDDGALIIPATNRLGSYVDFDGGLKSEYDIISKYRDMALEAEMDIAVNAIINEAITKEGNDPIVELDCSELEEYLDEKIIDTIRAEFEYIKTLLDFEKFGYEIFRRWYVDGRLYFNVIINNDDPTQGIIELRSIDARNTRKVREVAPQQLPKSQVNVIVKTDEYYIYSERNDPATLALTNANVIKITKDAMIDVTSGLLDRAGKNILSYLHKAIKPLNQLRMLEDASVIYRLARAPERRVWEIDVGNLPLAKAQQVMRETMNKYRNRMVYDASTGTLSDDRKFMTMTDDFWLARRSDGSGPKVSTLEGGQNLGEMGDVEYFREKLYNALNVPLSRIQPDDTFSLGREGNITRDEVAFQKFIIRLRTRFAELFYQALGKQLVLKRVMSLEEWESYQQKIRLIWTQDNYFAELKESEILRDRLATLGEAFQYIGFLFSQRWAYSKIMRMTDEEIEELEAEIQAEGLPLWLQLEAQANQPPGSSRPPPKKSK